MIKKNYSPSELATEGSVSTGFYLRVDVCIDFIDQAFGYIISPKNLPSCYTSSTGKKSQS